LVATNLKNKIKVESRTSTSCNKEDFLLGNPPNTGERTMPKKLHIATLGVHANKRIDYVVTKKGADKIALIYTERNEEEMKEFVDQYRKRSIPVLSKKVEPWNYRDILAEILEVAAAHREFEIEYNISCGTRVMTAAAHQAALFTDSKIYFVLGDYDEPLGEIVEVLPLSVTTLTHPKRAILEKIDGYGGKIDSQKQLGTRTSLKVSSISKHLREMEDAGYITRTRNGHRNKVEHTKLGKIMLKIKEYHKGKLGDGNNFVEDT
jgi:DNA-binding MarR family transcriptional regulator